MHCIPDNRTRRPGNSHEIRSNHKTCLYQRAASHRPVGPPTQPQVRVSSVVQISVERRGCDVLDDLQDLHKRRENRLDDEVLSTLHARHCNLPVVQCSFDTFTTRIQTSRLLQAHDLTGNSTSTYQVTAAEDSLTQFSENGFPSTTILHVNVPPALPQFTVSIVALRKSNNAHSFQSS